MYFRRYDLCGKDSVDATAFAYAGKKKPITNADRIRSMTDEELAEWMSARDVDLDPKCPPSGPLCVNYNDCASCWLDWLRKEADT